MLTSVQVPGADVEVKNVDMKVWLEQVGNPRSSSNQPLAECPRQNQLVRRRPRQVFT